jgi:urea transporter
MTSKRETLVLRSSSLGSWQKMTLGKAGLLSLTVPAILATWLAVEAATEYSRDNLSATFRSRPP